MRRISWIDQGMRSDVLALRSTGEPTGETELVHTGKEGGWLPHMAGKNNPSFAAVVGWVMPLDDSVAQRQGKPSLPLAYGLRLISHN